MLLVDAEDDRFCEPVRLLQELCQMASDPFRPRSERYNALKVLRLVLVIRDGAAVPVEFVLARTPAGRVPLGDDTMNAVRGEESVFDALSEAVLVNGIAE